MRLTDYKLNVCALAVLLPLVAPATPAGDGIRYNRDVRPILAENCFPCHGTDSASRKAGLRLDQAIIATNKLDDGAVAIVPGRPEKSELVRRIMATDDDHMPPAKVNKTLKPEQIAVLKKWIAGGAIYEPHWSFVAPVKAPLPKVKDTKWVRNEIDDFILARLEESKMKPNPEADKRTLIRRVTLDLTGLPPEPAAVEAFAADHSTGAYEKLVDRLLASPEYGEHRAHYWLDAARYGDTHGIHFDNYREMWSYRDWVINAFNENMPFSEFTVENLAGDLLPHATREQEIGSGFNRCNITSNEGGAIDEEYLVLYARDRTETTSQVWLGLTTGCAVCHDHKYDPITQKDFYSLSAFFNNNAQKAMDGNVKNTPPVIVVPKPADAKRWDALQPEIAANTDKIAARKIDARPDFEKWLAKPEFAGLDKNMPRRSLLFRAGLDDGESDTLRVTVTNSERTVALSAKAGAREGVVAAKAYVIATNGAPAFADVGDFDYTNAFSYAVWVRLANDNGGSLIARMSDKEGGHNTGWDLWLEGGKPAFHFIHNWPDDAIKIIGNQPLPKDKWVHVCLTYDGSAKAKGARMYVNGELQEVTVDKDALKHSTRTRTPFKLGTRDDGHPVAGAGLQDLRIYGRALTMAEVRGVANIPRLKYFVSLPAAQRGTNEIEELYPTWLTSADPVYLGLTRTKTALAKESEDIRERGTIAYVMQEKTNAPEAYVLFRGQYDQRRDRVTAATPASLPPMTADEPRNRLGFAEWLLRPDNPLTSRVTVNRFWQELFGIGLVKTAGDFGVAGDPPSNRELLDWLAVDFREHNWDLKRMYKLMVMSAAYRESADMTPEKIEQDPENRLLARGPRFRMDAEMVRDYALAASGLLVEKIGGPSTRPYQPPGLWDIVGMPQGDTRNYVQDHGDNLYRRSVYTFWKRQSPPASMEIFNAPSRETCTVRRERTDTPLQALVTLNDPQFVEAARQLAQESIVSHMDPVDFMAERLLAREFRPEEMKIVDSSLGQFYLHYKEQPKEAAELLAVGDTKPDPALDQPLLAAYTMVANELMNLDETLNK